MGLLLTVTPDSLRRPPEAGVFVALASYRNLTAILPHYYDFLLGHFYAAFMMNRWQHTGAFVLQLHPGANPAEGRFKGHVEHVASGQALRFRSLVEFLAFLTRVLADSGQERSEER